MPLSRNVAAIALLTSYELPDDEDDGHASAYWDTGWQATRVKLSDPSDQWTQGIHPEDLPRFQAFICDENKDKAFEVRLLREDGSAYPVSVVVDHFRFMGKQLSVVRLADGDSLPKVLSAA